jgi:hypothetical protein
LRKNWRTFSSAALSPVSRVRSVTVMEILDSGEAEGEF